MCLVYCLSEIKAHCPQKLKKTINHIYGGSGWCGASVPHWPCLSGQSVAVATQPCCGTKVPGHPVQAPLLPPTRTGQERSSGYESPATNIHTDTKYNVVNVALIKGCNRFQQLGYTNVM